MRVQLSSASATCAIVGCLAILSLSIAAAEGQESNAAADGAFSRSPAVKDSLVNRLEVIVNKVKSIKARLNQTLNETSLLAMQHDLLTRTGYNFTAGLGYHKFYVEKLAWKEALQFCRRRDSHLAVLDSPAEVAVLGEIVKHRQSLSPHAKVLAYVGVHDYAKTGSWMTIFFDDLEGAKHVSWKDGMLNYSENSIVPQCGAIDEDGRLHSSACTDKRPFICEAES